MTRKICSAFVLALLMGFLFAAAPWAGAQAPAEKSATPQEGTEKNAIANSAKEKEPADKSKAENNAMVSASFPQLDGPIELQSGADKRISLKMTDTSRAIYEAIGQQAGISVLFDPDYYVASRPFNVNMNDVSLSDALKMIAFETKTFWRPVTSNSIFVAVDTVNKRRELEQQIVKTFYLPNLSSLGAFQDVVNSLRAILQIDRVQQIYEENTIIVRGTPEQMALAQKLIDDVNNEAKKKAGQYRLEFKINELMAEKKLNSRAYVLLLEPHQVGKLRIGTRVPITTTEKDKTIQFQYVDLGKNIDSQVISEGEHSVGLHISVEFSGLALSERTTPKSTSQVSHGTPTVQQLRMDTNATVEPGKPTIVGTLDDPVSNRTFQIEVTATRLNGSNGNK